MHVHHHTTWPTAYHEEDLLCDIWMYSQQAKKGNLQQVKPPSGRLYLPQRSLLWLQLVPGRFYLLNRWLLELQVEPWRPHMLLRLILLVPGRHRVWQLWVENCATVPASGFATAAPRGTSETPSAPEHTDAASTGTCATLPAPAVVQVGAGVTLLAHERAPVATIGLLEP
ncbi:hypothetical protein GN244_ATG13812 [Phytophthora infestans]|uniref:Uncharacterized protein n=1 Tax=Phytophthora infestans TaxID=4787 RepID=A0A833S680_PHYIN|nr:hypothetical protein GN244_ATG13812 [Phytophthora infestans]